MADEVIAGRYRLIEPLGRGAMSSVWLAEDQELGRRVAVKMLGPTADRQRFEREARAAAAVSHPNIAAVYDYGEVDNRPYMVLEHLPNGSLEDRLKNGPLPDDEAMRIATEIASGLAHAHERGLVHRDLKPANILFDGEGRAKIADFGIARMGNQGTLTEAGTVLGTASYISPEQASGLPAGPPSDVYSFGVILFRMLTGQLPFVSGNAMELVRMHRDDEPPPVSAFRDDAPAVLEGVASAALLKDPASRPADGGALLRELRGSGEAGTMIMAPPPAEATQVLRPAGPPPSRGRNRALVPLIALVLVLLGGGVALAFLLTGNSSPDTTSTTPAGLTLPTISTAPTTHDETTTTAPTTTAAQASTTAPTTTTTPTTTHRATTTAPATTPTIVPPTTTLAPPTTTVAPPTTTAVTTDTIPTGTVTLTTPTTTIAP